MLDFFYPQTVETVDSPINGQIKVTRFRGKYSVWVGGFEQSGPVYVERVWQKALNNLVIEKCNDVLVLGLGCGTVIPLILQKWPTAKIVGVEIDPEMVRLGKKYFGLAKYRNLEIVRTDALKYIQKLKRKFDLVLVDAYVGEKVVEWKKALSKTGQVILANNLEGFKNSVKILSPSFET